SRRPGLNARDPLGNRGTTLQGAHPDPREGGRDGRAPRPRPTVAPHGRAPPPGLRRDRHPDSPYRPSWPRTGAGRTATLNLRLPGAASVVTSRSTGGFALPGSNVSTPSSVASIGSAFLRPG